jgi:hypothetical protein
MNLAMTLLLGCAFFISPGCKTAAVIVAKTVGETINAKYVPNKNDPMLVVAENYQNPGANALESEQLARYVCRGLEKKQVAPLIDPTLVMDLRSKDPDAFRKMTITQIGQKFGARQVMYISILSDGIQDTTGAEFRRGEASALVRIVDVSTGETRWPGEAASGYPISTKTPVTKVASEADEAALKRATQARLGGDIARLFYKYKRDEEGDDAFGGGTSY